jgi:hypothetical protein
MNVQVILAKIKAYPVAVSLVVAAIIMALVAYFRQDSLSDAQDQSKSLDDQSKTMTNNIVFGGNLKTNLAQLREAQKSLTVALIDPDSIIENQQYFYGFERIDGLHIVDPMQSHTDRDKDATMSVTTFTLEATGNWAAMTAFLYSLQTGPHLVRVSHLVLEKYNQSGRDALPEQLSATLEVQVLGK